MIWQSEWLVVGSPVWGGSLPRAPRGMRGGGALKVGERVGELIEVGEDVRGESVKERERGIWSLSLRSWWIFDLTASIQSPALFENQKKSGLLSDQQELSLPIEPWLGTESALSVQPRLVSVVVVKFW